MSGELIAAKITAFLRAIEEKKVEQALSLCTDNPLWMVPEGTLKGKEEFKQYLSRMMESNDGIKCVETGVGLSIQENTGILEYIFRGQTTEGLQWEVLAFSVFEFKGDKIYRLTTVYDRLPMARQTAKGWLTKTAVNSVINHVEKGLHQ